MHWYPMHATDSVAKPSTCLFNVGGADCQGWRKLSYAISDRYSDTQYERSSRDHNTSDFARYERLLQDYGVPFTFTICSLRVIATFRPFALIGQTTCILSPIRTITPDFSPFEMCHLADRMELASIILKHMITKLKVLSQGKNCSTTQLEIHRSNQDWLPQSSH